MNATSETILFVVNFAVNLLLFGLIVSGGGTVALRLIKNANPRLRYVISITAFLIASFFPLAATLNGSSGLDKFLATKPISDEILVNFDSKIPVATAKINSPALNHQWQKPFAESLNNFTATIAESLVSIIFFSLWITGAACFLLREIFAHRQIRKARKNWRLATNREREELLLPDSTLLFFGNESPATIGFFYPMIVLPEHFPDDLSLATKRLIIRHELAHARWRDPLINGSLRVIRALFWISPALWRLEKTIEIEREFAADFAAIDKSDFETSALNYAAALVAVAKHFNVFSRRGLHSPTIGLNSGDILENRVRRLLLRSSEPTIIRFSFAAIIFALSLGGLVFMPIAFQSKTMKFSAQSAIADNPDEVKLTSNESIKNKSKDAEFIISNQNENKREESSKTVKGNFSIPQLISKKREQVESLQVDETSENLMKKRSAEDAKAAGIEKKLDELSKKVQGLDAARKDLESRITQARQKAASQIDSLMRQNQSPDDSEQKSN